MIRSMKVFAALLVVSLAAVAIARAADKRPNILFIIADDQSPFDFKTYNPASALQTPVLDKLAAGGMVFDAAYHMGSFSGAVCSPSRRMIMSGRTLWHLKPTGKKRRKKGDKGKKAAAPSDPNPHQYTLPAVFNGAGYATMRTCKNGNSYEGANALFTVRRDATRRGGTDSSGSAWHADQVLDYLSVREKKKNPAPFLIYFGFSHPHDTRDGKTGLLKKYGAVNHKNRKELPPANSRAPKLPINWLPAHPFHHGHPGLRDEVSVSGVWERRDEITIRNEIGRQFACGENIDIQVGRVLKKLKAMGELDNTYIFYTSDHGMAIGRHGLQGKQNLMAWMKDNEEVARMSAVGGSTANRSDQPIQTIVTSTAPAMGITVKRFEPESEDKLRVWLAKVSFDKTMRWLHQIESRHGIRIVNVSIDAERETGLVTAKLVLQK